MKAKLSALGVVLILFGLLVVACAPQATPTPASTPEAVQQTQAVSVTEAPPQPATESPAQTLPVSA